MEVSRIVGENVRLDGLGTGPNAQFRSQARPAQPGLCKWSPLRGCKPGVLLCGRRGLAWPAEICALGLGVHQHPESFQDDLETPFCPVDFLRLRPVPRPFRLQVFR